MQSARRCSSWRRDRTLFPSWHTSSTCCLAHAATHAAKLVDDAFPLFAGQLVSHSCEAQGCACRCIPACRRARSGVFDTPGPLAPTHIFTQVQGELALVDKTKEAVESFARVSFSPKCEAAINEQIK